jgi:hypothetical protein
LVKGLRKDSTPPEMAKSWGQDYDNCGFRASFEEMRE